MPRAPRGAVRTAVEKDLVEIRNARTGAPPASATLMATARVLADVLDAEGPATPKVAAMKTLLDVMTQLRAPLVVPAGGGASDVVERGRNAARRRRGAAA